MRILGLIALTGILATSTCLAGCVIAPVVGGVITTLLTPVVVPRAYPAPQIIVIPRDEPREEPKVTVDDVQY